MLCTTECWNCEDKTCEHYISKQGIYFKYGKLESNWNSLRDWLENEIKRLMNIEQTNNVIFLIASYDNVLDKMKGLEGKKI